MNYLIRIPKTKKFPNLEKDDYASWLGVSEEEDAKQTIHTIANKKPDWLIIDHYSLGEKWEKKLRGYVRNILVIDDIANRKHDCDILLDQNWYKDMKARYSKLLSLKCIKIFGPKYALLRPEFSQERKVKINNNKKIKKIFIFFGGSDPQNLTGMTLNALSDPIFNYLELDVVLGAGNCHINEIQKLTESREYTNLYVQVDNIASIMKKADLAIGSGGVNTWERICLNLESHVIISAENQKELNEQLNDCKYISLIGYSNTVNSNVIQSHIKNRLSTNRYVQNLSDLSLICDGKGADRVVSLLKLSFNA